MKQNISQILILFIFFVLEVFFIIYNEKLYQKIGLKNFDDIGSSTLFSVIDKMQIKLISLNLI